MKRLLIVGCMALGVAVAGFAQSSTQELPSAPSASLPQPKPAVQKPPAQTQAAPAQNQQPTTSSPAEAPAPETNQQTAPVPQQPATKPTQQPTQPTRAQDQPDPDVPTETIRKIVNEVNVVFTVTDKHGRFVKDLKQDDLKVLDDDKPPTQIVHFSSETDLPLRVGLLVDASNSIRDRFKFEQDAAIEFLNQIIRPKMDQAFVLGFDTTAEVTQDYTDSTEELSRGVRALRPGGGTALFDAIYAACRDKLSNPPRGDGRPSRRAIILLSDGEDNQSRVTREEAIEMAQRAEVIVYAISTNITGIKSKGDKVLERFAEMTGGRLFTPFKLQEVADAFTDIQDELRSQYAISYKPADFVADGRYRTIEIEPTKKNLRVRARRGYYAPKPNATASSGGTM
jgi:VWFA-related protein